MLAWNLLICMSSGICKELRKQRIFKEWKIECTSINKTKKRIRGGSLNLVQGIEGQFRRGLEGDTNSAKDFFGKVIS